MPTLQLINAVWAPSRGVPGVYIPWDPTALGANLRIWMKGSVGVTSSLGRVSDWASQADSFSYTQGTAANQPLTNTTTLNGLNVVESFDTLSYMVNTAFVTTGQNISKATCVSVVKFANYTGTNFIMGISVNAAGNNRIAWSTTTTTGAPRLQARRLDADSNTVSTPGASVPTAAAWTILSQNLDHTSQLSGASTNGENLVTVATGLTAGLTTNSTSGRRTLWTNASFTTGGSLAIAEVIYYENDVTTASRQAAEGYLAWRYALTANLPAGHPYKSAPP